MKLSFMLLSSTLTSSAGFQISTFPPHSLIASSRQPQPTKIPQFVYVKLRDHNRYEYNQPAIVSIASSIAASTATSITSSSSLYSTKEDKKIDEYHTSASSQKKRKRTQTQTNTSIEKTKRKKRTSTTRNWTNSATTITGKWRQNYEALQEYAHKHNHTRVPYNYIKNPRLGRWVMRQRVLYNEYELQQQRKRQSDATNSESTNKKEYAKSANTPAPTTKKGRPATVLTEERIEALKAINFSFESPRKRTWNRRFDELCQYRALYGDCLVPIQFDDIPGLGVWVRNQRTQYRNVLQGKRVKALTPEKISALKSIGFVWDTQRNDQWKKRFDELVDFKMVYGHCSVPENYHENRQLGAWVTNQRTSYKNFFAGSTGMGNGVGYGNHEQEQPNVGSNACKGLTREKIAALESIGFCWDQTTYNWYSMYERLKRFKNEQMNEEKTINDKQKENGGVNVVMIVDDIESSNVTSHNKYFHVPPEDVENRDLRLWISVQRREYSNYMQNKNNPNSGTMKRTSMTPRRKRALDEIKFPWSINRQQKYTEGPSVDDWTKLFEQMREKGIDKDARPKEHWFEGQSIFTDEDQPVSEKEQWTDDDLLELWNMEDDDNDDV